MSGVSFGHVWDMSGVFLLNMFQAYFGHVSDMFRRCLKHVWDMFGTCFGHLWNMFWICVGHVLDMFGTCVGQFWSNKIDNFSVRFGQKTGQFFCQSVA